VESNPPGARICSTSEKDSVASSAMQQLGTAPCYVHIPANERGKLRVSRLTLWALPPATNASGLHPQSLELHKSAGGASGRLPETVDFNLSGPSAAR
jgi:hypothetical protein